MKWVGLIVCCLMSVRIFAQGYSDAAQTALAGSNVVSFRNGIQHLNPAAISQNKSKKIGLSQALPYTLPEIRYNSIFYIFHHKNNYIGVDYNHLSFDALIDQTVSILYAKKLNDKLSLGIKIKNNFIQIEANRYYKVIPEIGFVYNINKYLDIGSYWLQSQSLLEFNQWQSSLKTGVKFKKLKKLAIYVSTEINSNAHIVIKSALEYQSSERLASRIALSTDESYLSFGVYYKIKRLEIECANSLHKYLGMSPCLTLSYEIK